MHNIIIHDHKNKFFEIFNFVSNDMEELMTKNIAKIQYIYPDINMHSFSDRFTTFELEKKDYELKRGLYEILVFEYNKLEKIKLKKFV